MDLYKELEVEKAATPDEIKSAYRKLAMKYHPDRNPGDKEAETKFKKVQEAYDILSDTAKRARYDSTGSTSHTSPPPHSHHSNIWDSFFGHAPNQDRGRNIQVTIEIELKDVLNGLTKKIVIPKRAKCTKCDGSGQSDFKACTSCHGSGKTAIKQSPFNIYMGCTACRGTGRSGVVDCVDCKKEGFITVGSIEVTVRIPPGVDSGHVLRVNGYGEPAKTPTGKNGDLNVVIKVKEDKVFKKHDSNINIEFPVGYSDLCSGCVLEIPTLSGVASVTIPPNTQDYTQFRLKGLGLPHLHSGKGDLFVIVRLQTLPKAVVDENKELFDKLANLEKEHLLKARQKFKKET